MDLFETTEGYQPAFLGEHKVSLPFFHPTLIPHIAPVKGNDDNIVQYSHFSLIQNSTRRFPFFTASNVDGNRFHKINRREASRSWSKDPRIADEHQWGEELYKADFSDFDRGHMTKREDVQWGNTEEDAKLAAQLTFYYTNAVPQHRQLNQIVWRRLEDYILHNETIDNNLKINVFTGPVFSPLDPTFITEIDTMEVALPTLFWKIIYYVKNEKLYCIGFLMGQDNLLRTHQLVREVPTPRGIDNRIFQQFKDANTYQVNIETIEDLTSLHFANAHAAYTDDRPTQLILEEVNIRGVEGESMATHIHGLQL